MTNKHTQGPWHEVDCGGGVIAIHDQPDRKGRYEQLATCYHKDNARLIASAPDLLAERDALLAECEALAGVLELFSTLDTTAQANRDCETARVNLLACCPEYHGYCKQAKAALSNRAKRKGGV